MPAVGDAFSTVEGSLQHHQVSDALETPADAATEAKFRVSWLFLFYFF